MHLAQGHGQVEDLVGLHGVLQEVDVLVQQLLLVPVESQATLNHSPRTHQQLIHVQALGDVKLRIRAVVVAQLVLALKLGVARAGVEDLVHLLLVVVALNTKEVIVIVIVRVELV